jgi:hypothetical protein
VGENWAKWLQLVGVFLLCAFFLSMCALLVGIRIPSFGLVASVFCFLVKAMYNDLVVGTGIPFNCCTWKAKIPLKIKIFPWCLRKGVIFD